MTPTTSIRTRRDGSIDTTHYIALGRAARSRQAHDMARAGGRGLARAAMAGTAVIAALVVLPVLF